MLLHSFFYNSKLIYGENSCQTIKYRMFFDSLTKCFKPVTKNFCIHLAIFGNTMVDIGKCITSSPCVLHVFSNTTNGSELHYQQRKQQGLCFPIKLQTKVCSTGGFLGQLPIYKHFYFSFAEINRKPTFDAIPDLVCNNIRFFFNFFSKVFFFSVTPEYFQTPSTLFINSFYGN